MAPQKSLHYFDHNATTPVCPEVLSSLPELIQAWGNPSSIHWGGRMPKNIIREARANIAQAIGAHPLEIVFTSGGSEANNTVIRSVFDYFQESSNKEVLSKRNHYMCSSVEHPSVIKSMKYLESKGARVDFIPVSRQGDIDLDFFADHLSEQTALVSVMFANNETGTLFPVKELCRLAHLKGALFHTDAVQAFGKVPLDLAALGVDFASFSGHKFYSVKGSGFLYSKKGSVLSPLILGGGQERRRRGGTENTLGIGSLGIVAKRSSLIEQKSQEMGVLRDHLEARILSEIADSSVTAGQGRRLPNTSSLVLDQVDGETLLMSLDIIGYAVSTGAACSSGNPEPSPVLLAMGLSRHEAQSSLRLSIGWDTKREEIDNFVEALKTTVARLRMISRNEGESIHV